ncbi:AbrB family transcriptional regulator (plasmid) [Sphingomonas paeninsulae]|uniref:AbrB family transcriptional regulator n=1 Tax=Sphingomonas paeninsulae TaxID=2319844 RepID=A0A494T943_SPHPE|nr:type II toxin-antitoxin system PrlF family antitoxin [Sphingomonas paeninsulae]AYJ85460.1 AbrB family transcriptional regulator [Sphingomonas paeninsulae]
MAVTLEEISTITAKGQTTVPKAVRQALGVDYGGRIAYRVDARGVTLVRAEDNEDPAISRFLDFLADDIKIRPEAIKALSPDLAARINMLTNGLSDDLEAEIVGEVSL